MNDAQQFNIRKGYKMTQNAQIALKAAFLRNSIGLFAARRMIERAGVPVYLYRLACQLQAAQKGGEL